MHKPGFSKGLDFQFLYRKTSNSKFEKHPKNPIGFSEGLDLEFLLLKQQIQDFQDILQERRIKEILDLIRFNGGEYYFDGFRNDFDLFSYGFDKF